VAEVEEALSIPRGAIITEATESHVFVVEGDVVVARKIEFSDWPAERVMVTEGLSAGDLVVLDPSAVAAGEKVKVE
jgi:membrane fusion protein (multidrug efflux system)